jgi:hypothetical protein
MKKRKNRLKTSVNNDAKQAIDLTCDDTDIQRAGKDSGAIKTQQPATRTATISGGTPRRPRHPPIAAATLNSTKSPNSLNDSDFVDVSDHKVSPSERSAKRARCEDVTDTTDTGMKVLCAKQYHMAPPGCPAISLGNTTATDDLGFPPKLAFNGISLQNPTNTHPCFGLEATPPRFSANTEHPFVTNPDTLHKPAESMPSAHQNASLTYAETMATADAEHNVKREHLTARQDSASPPSLKVKIKLAREFSQALEVPEHYAYHLLMSCSWVVDDAVLAHMATNVEGEKAEDGKKKEKNIVDN